MTNFINNIITALNIMGPMWGIRSNAEVYAFSDANVTYKAMLFINENGEFVPVIAFRNPFEGKRILHRIIGGVPCNNVEGNWRPSEGVSILWGMNDGSARYTVTTLTAWERFHRLTFITSFGWMKGWSAKDAFDAISFFSALGTNDTLTGGWDYSTIEKWSIHIDDDSILGIVHSSYFRNAFEKAMSMKKPTVPKKQKIIVDTSAYRK